MELLTMFILGLIGILIVGIILFAVLSPAQENNSPTPPVPPTPPAEPMWIKIGDLTAVFPSSRVILNDNGNVYVGGEFIDADGVTVNNIAFWNGSTSSWSTIGDGFEGMVYALAIFNDFLYAGGNFRVSGVTTDLNNIARFDGESWVAVGDGFDGPVFSLVATEDTLYAGGIFTTSGAVTDLNNVAQWGGSSWAPIGDGFNGAVNALKLNGTDLYAGGAFTSTGVFGGPDLNYIAKWDGSSLWEPIGDGFDVEVKALEFLNDTLYVGGLFDASGATTGLNRIAQWDGSSSWLPVSGGVSSSNPFKRVVALKSINGSLYVGGYFETAGSSPANAIAQWNPSTSLWSPLGDGVSSTGFFREVFALESYTSGSNSYVLVGGRFDIIGDGISAVSIGEYGPV